MKRCSYTLKASCTDTVGIVATVTGFIADRGGLITEMSHFVDDAAQKSFIRLVFEDDAEGGDGLSAMQQSFKEQVARRFGMRFAFFPADSKVRTLIAVSRQSHCLNSMLHQWSSGHLPIDITGVVSNHEDQRSLVQWYGLDYHHYPITTGKKPEQEAKILALFEETHSGLLVLARYMQVLTAHACEQLAGRAINIHHSFLPGFKGARPYHQAYERGVKLIGATAHYINTDLDEGPIIEQDIVRITPAQRPEDYVSLGRDVESQVLARAIHAYVHGRVFMN
ncbi:MAG: formyltetrahydrofolate deformylase, partial [Lysobacterales bacterium]